MFGQPNSFTVAEGYAVHSNWVGTALVLALIFVTVVIGWFYYLNRHAKRQYFVLWSMAWVAYAVYLVAALALQETPDSQFLVMVRRLCIGISGLFMFWGSFELTGRRRSHRELGLSALLLVVWALEATYGIGNPQWLTIPYFTLLGIAGIYTGYIYLARRSCYRGATILGSGFLLWGSHLLIFPFLEVSTTSMAVSYVVTAVLAITIAIGMVVEKEVNVAEKNYRILFDSASDAVFLVDMWSLQILEANRAAGRLARRATNELVGRSFVEICPSLDAPRKNVLDNQKIFRAVFRPYEEFYVLQGNGERCVCEGEMALAEWLQRLVFQVNIRDVGERKKVGQQIQRADKLSALGQLIAGVAHELNNPLAIVMGTAQLLTRRNHLDEATKQELQRIQDQSERAARIVRDLLSYARPSEPKKVPLDLNHLVSEVMDWRRNDLSAARINVATKLARTLPLTKADQMQIEQILSNIIGNAIDALKEQPLPREIVVTTEETTSFLRVSIADNGPGIPPDNIGKIFDPFFTTKPIGRGTGLGLTICNTYIQEHRGKIWVDSKPGKGATFYFDLPLLPCEAIAYAAPETPAEQLVVAAGQSQGRLLIVDDEPDIVTVLKAILEECGYQIETASNGSQALQLLSTETFDVVLSDIRMPDLDGQALYQRLREIKPALANRVIFVTGDTVSGSTREFLDKTGNLWLGKPFQINDVIDRVQRAIRFPQTAPGMAN